MKKKLQKLYSVRLALYGLYQEGILSKEAYLKSIRPLDEKVDLLESTILLHSSFWEKEHG